MEIKVTFRFDASDSLLSCVDNFRKAMEAMAASGGLSVLPENKEAGIVKAIATKEGVTVNKKEQIWPPKGESAEPQPAEPQPEKPQPAEPQPAEPKPTAEKETNIPSIADMRAAVTRARERIEGEDWEGKTSDGYKMYHKKLTSAVKGIVAICGAEKIPDIAEENRQNFINLVDLLIANNGEVTSEAPF